MPDSSPHSGRAEHEARIRAEAQRCHRDYPARYGGIEFAQTYYTPIIRELEEQLAIAETERDDFEASQARLLEQVETLQRERDIKIAEAAEAQDFAHRLHEQLEAARDYLEGELSETRSSHVHINPDKCVICERCRTALALLGVSYPANDLGTSSAGNEDVPNPASEPDVSEGVGPRPQGPLTSGNPSVGLAPSETSVSQDGER